MLSRLTSRLHAIHKVSSLVDQALVSGGNFLALAICAHALPLAEQGKFTYIFASYMALLLFNVAGIFQGAAVRAPTQEHHAYKITLARMQLLQAFLLALLVICIWLGAGGLFGWTVTNTEAWLLFAFLVLQQLADFDRRIAYIFSSTKRAIFSSAMLYPARIIGLLIIQPDTVIQVLVVLVLSSIIPAAFTVFAACCRIREGVQSWMDTAIEHFVYSRLFIAGAPLGWLWAYIPIFMLGIMHSKEQAALLGSIRGIANVANILMEQIETKVVADWARLHHENDIPALEVAVSGLLRIGMAIWLAGMVTIAIFGKEIVDLLLGSLYAPHWNLLVIGWIGYGVYFIARIFGIKHRTLGANQIEFKGNVFGVAAAILAGFAMIPALCATGAAWVYVIIAMTMLVSQILALKNVRMLAK
jgi:O-antigen/teichoic acid export membrane protein